MRWSFFLPIALVACAPEASEPQPPIAEAWQARCGNCHARVEPHSRPRAQLAAALERHRARTRLSEEEWREMEDYLVVDKPQVSGRAR